MKICLIAASLETLGGQAVQAAEIVERFQKAGVAIDFLPINPRLKGIWGACQRIKYLRTLVTSAAYIYRLIRKVPSYDVLHIFSASFLSFLIAPTPAILIGKLYKKRVVLNYHSGEAKDHLRRSEGTVKRILKYVDVLAVPSAYLQEVFRKFGIEAEVVHNLVSQDLFPYKERKAFKPNFIVTRNLEPMYNVACVLQAFRLVQDSYPQAGLTIVGSGSQEASLRRLSEDLKLEHVVFAGRVERDAISKYYEKHDFMLNASTIDNMPMSILEAFSSGLPVISTDAGGIPYIIEDQENGMLVPMDDEKALAEKALYLLDHQEAAHRISHNAFNDYSRHYTWETNRQRWLDLYGTAG